jgi:predicted permease
MQVALTFALIGSSTLLLRSLWNLQAVPLGFETERVLSAAVALNTAKYPTPERQVAAFERLLESAAATPGTVATAVTDSLPPSGNMRSMIFARIEVAGRPLPKEGTGGMVGWRLVTPGYFDALRIPNVRGRAFAQADRMSAEPSMILNETLERKLFPNDSALGQRVRPGGADQPWHVIVGIAKDARNSGLSAHPDPEYYVVRGTAARDATRRSFLVVRTQTATPAAVAFLREAVAAVDPELPVTVDTMQQRVSQLSARPRFTAFLLISFGFLAMILAATGLAGVAGYLVTERARDIGVRMALGATAGAIRREVLGEAARWVAGGAMLGVVVAAAASRLLASLLYGITPSDPWAWAAALAILAAVLLLSVLRPALRAARIDPAVALRAE